MIFYFSATGNTKWAAETVAKALGDEVFDIAELLRNADDKAILTFSPSDDEPLGFFYPVHGWRPPRIVRDFIRRLDVKDATRHFCYAVCTAGDTIGEAEKILEKDLARIGIHTDSAISLLMPESYVGLPFMDVDDKKNEARKKDIAKKKLEKFIDDIRRKKSGTHSITIGKWPRINSRFIGAAFIKWLVTDAPFKVSYGKCIGCGKCQKACPVRDIRMNDDHRPTWLHNGKCLACFACYHHCPVHAIEYGRMTKHKGQYYFERKQADV